MIFIRNFSLFVLCTLTLFTERCFSFEEKKCHQEKEGINLLLKEYLKNYLSVPEGVRNDDTRFSFSEIHLEKKNIEIVVYVTGRNWCASGGCTFLILDKKENSFQLIGNSGIVRLPIRKLHTERYGRPDIGVWVQGGGVQPGYEAALPFDGEKYPDNPTLPPAKPTSPKDEGLVLIPRDDRGDLLYSK